MQMRSAHIIIIIIITISQNDPSFVTFTVVMFQIEVFCMVTPCSIVAGYHHFGGEDGGIMDL
jgi:hypothetical protein